MIPGSGRSPGEDIGYPLQYSWASLVAQLVKNPPVMRETWVQPLGWEDALEKGRLPTPVFWPGELHELYSPWGHKSRTRLSDFHVSIKLESTIHRGIEKSSSNSFFVFCCLVEEL